MALIPSSHIIDADKLDADGKVHLYELNPSAGTGTLRFNANNQITWLGNTYSSIPCAISGDTQTAQGSNPQATMTIGQPDIDLSIFKPLIWAGGLDNARIVRYKVLLDDIINNANIKETNVFRVKKVDSYSATEIKLNLAVFSPSGPSTIPFRQFVPPDFPYVVL